MCWNKKKPCKQKHQEERKIRKRRESTERKVKSKKGNAMVQTVLKGHKIH